MLPHAHHVNRLFNQLVHIHVDVAGSTEVATNTHSCKVIQKRKFLYMVDNIPHNIMCYLLRFRVDHSTDTLILHLMKPWNVAVINFALVELTVLCTVDKQSDN